MGEPVHRRWTIEEFFAWRESQPDRYELVDGRPLEMMAGAKNVHDDFVVNLIGELRDQLRGSGRRPLTRDRSVERRAGQIRRPTSVSIMVPAIPTPRRRRSPSCSSKSSRRARVISTLSASWMSTRELAIGTPPCWSGRTRRLSISGRETNMDNGRETRSRSGR